MSPGPCRVFQDSARQSSDGYSDVSHIIFAGLENQKPLKLRFVTFRYVSLRYVSLRSVPFRSVSLRCVSLCIGPGALRQTCITRTLRGRMVTLLRVGGGRSGGQARGRSTTSTPTDHPSVVTVARAGNARGGGGGGWGWR